MVSDRTVLVRLKANVSDFQRGMMSARAAMKGLTSEIDTTNDRTAWLAQSITGFGPALVPLAGAAVPAVAALATQMTVAAGAAGVAVLALNGVGDGIKALNTYELDPTAANFEKLGEAMEKIGPAGAELVDFLNAIGPQFSQLAMTARAGGFFDGIQDGILGLLPLLPQLNRIVAEISAGLGELTASSGAGLGGEKFAAFFDYLESDARPILLEMGQTLGGFAEGIANLMVAFGPLTMSFSTGFADMAQSFAEWSRTLDSNSGFQGFLEYIEEVGPMAMDFLGSLVTAFAAILQAAAPIGEVLLPVFSRFLDIVGALAASPIGPIFVGAAAAVGLYGRAVALASVTTGGFGKGLGQTAAFGERFQKSMRGSRPTLQQFGSAMAFSAHSSDTLRKSLASTSVVASTSAKKALEARSAVGSFARSVGPAATSAALLGVVMTGAADKMGASNTATLAMAGSLAGPWGTAIGAAIGAALDFQNAGDDISATLDGINKALESGGWDAAAEGAANLSRQLDDLNNHTGVLDFISDTLKTASGDLRGDLQQNSRFSGKPVVEQSSQASNAQQDAAQAYSYKRAGELAAKADREAAAAAALAAAGYRLVGGGAATAALDLRNFADAAKAGNAEMSQQGAMDAYRSSLLDFNEGLKENGRTLAINTRAGLANRANLRGIATDAIAAGEGIKGAAAKSIYLQRARKNFIDAAVRAGMLRDKAADLATEFGLLDRIRAKPNVTEQGSAASRKRVRDLKAAIDVLRSKMVRMDEKGAAAARARIAAMRAEIDRLQSKTVTLTTNQVTRYSVIRASGAAVAGQAIRADGGAVYAGPGQSRGPKDDSIEARLSHREWVQPVAAVDYYGEAFMEAVRTRSLPKPQGYAEGGSPSYRPNISVSSPSVAVGGADVRVIIDGREVRAIVDERMADHEDMAGMWGRSGG